MARRRLRLPVGQLGDVRKLAGHTWVWRCWIAPCCDSRERREPQLSKQAAEDHLVAHLVDYHEASAPAKSKAPP